MAKGQTADYFFCRNTKCSFHAMFLLKDKPKEMVQGAACPVCKEGKLEVVELETTAPVVPATGEVPTGIVLPVPPYGGFTLTFGDSDETQTWEQVTGHPEPRHQNARYVAELQRDLMRLGFYSHGREAASDKAGEFTLSVMSGVLDLKRHLSEVYGFGVSEDMEAVKKGADAGAGPIYYRAMKNPALVFTRAQKWSAGVSGVRKSLDEWAKLWEASKKGEKAQSVEEVDQLEAERVQLTADVTALKARRKKAKDTADTITTATLPALRRKVQALKTGVATAADPEAVKKEIADMEQKIKELEKEIGTINGDLGKQKQQIDQMEQKLGALPGKIKVARERVKKRDDAYASMMALAGQVTEEADESTLLMQQLGHRPASHFNVKLGPSPGNYQGDRALAIAAMKKLLKEDTDAKKAGAAVGLPLRAGQIEKGWAEAKVGAPGDWTTFKAKLEKLKSSLAAYEKEASDPATEGTKLYDGYRQELREFGKVDAATARMIRQMVWTGELGGRAVFWLPMDDEIEPLDAKGPDETIRALVDDLKVVTTVGGKKVTRDRNNSPIDLLHFIFVHESGAKHTMKFGGREYVTIGIDWQNGPSEDKSMFKEHLTNPARWSASRGWGFTQKTYFDAPVKARDKNGKMREYEMHAGIPYVAKGDLERPNPEPIASAKWNLAAGVGLYLQNFNYSPSHRDCTYKQPYQCSKCVKNFQVTPLGTFDAKGKFTPTRKDSSILFDDGKTEYERVKHPTMGTIALRMTNAEKMKDLVAKGEYTAGGGDGTDFPCSWITAVIRYAGSGNQAYWYGLEAMWTMQGKPVPAQ